MDLGSSRPAPIFIIQTTKFVSKKDYHLYQCIKTQINILSAAQENKAKGLFYTAWTQIHLE